MEHLEEITMNDHESNERPEEPHETPQEIEDNTVNAPPTGNAPIDEGRKPAVPTPPAGSIFPVPPAISAALEFTWDENKPTVEIRGVPYAIWQRARQNALLSGLAFKEYVICLLAKSEPVQLDALAGESVPTEAVPD